MNNFKEIKKHTYELLGNDRMICVLSTFQSRITLLYDQVDLIGTLDDVISYLEDEALPELKEIKTEAEQIVEEGD